VLIYLEGQICYTDQAFTALVPKATHFRSQVIDCSVSVADDVYERMEEVRRQVATAGLTARS
jgi:hypothetical protein